MTDVQENHSHTSCVELIALNDFFFAPTIPNVEVSETPAVRNTKGQSNDNGMTFILERVHFISIYFSAFVCRIPKRHFGTNFGIM